MLIPSKYEDIRRSPLIVGATILQLLQQDTDVNWIMQQAMHPRLKIADWPALSFAEVVNGLVFLFACGLISVQGTKVVLHATH